MRVLATLLLIALLSSSSFASDIGSSTRFQPAGISYDDAKAFYSELREAVSHGNKKVVVTLLMYPFGTKINGVIVNIKNERECLKYYDQLFTQKVVDSLNDTSFEDLEVFYTGVSTKGGIVWFGGTKLKSKKTATNIVRVIAINS
jgi:hypothetical protein